METMNTTMSSSQQQTPAESWQVCIILSTVVIKMKRRIRVGAVVVVKRKCVCGIPRVPRSGVPHQPVLPVDVGDMLCGQNVHVVGIPSIGRSAAECRFDRQRFRLLWTLVLIAPPINKEIKLVLCYLVCGRDYISFLIKYTIRIEYESYAHA